MLENILDNKQLQNEILEFKEKVKSTQHVKTKPAKDKNMVFIYGVFVDILAGVITAFILYRIYQHYFTKNTIVFAILLVLCVAGGFYGTMKMLINNNNKNT